jgi:hypothetical protein
MTTHLGVALWLSAVISGEPECFPTRSELLTIFNYQFSIKPQCFNDQF